MLKIAFYQQEIVMNQPLANYQKVESAFAKVKADILVVPETFNVGFGGDMVSQAEPQEGPTLQFAKRMASVHQALFVGTWVVKENGKAYNRMHWVRPDGSFGYYDKHHTFRISKEYTQITQGTNRPTFFWKGWKIRPAVCYDLRFPAWLRNGNPQYDLMIVCANWPASRSYAWTTLLQARAIENQSYIVGVNCVGKHYEGDSLAADYGGHIIKMAPKDADSVTSVELNLDDLKAYRQKFPFYLDTDGFTLDAQK